MKQITITLPDADASKFVAQLMDMNVTFTVQTTVARDPLVFAALETPRVGEPQAAQEPTDPNHVPDPTNVEAGIKGRHSGPPTAMRNDPRWGKHKVQRLTPDGRTSMEVVEAKLAQIGGRKFRLRDITDLSAYSGFRPHTLQTQIQILVGHGRVVKLNRFTFREVPPNLQGKRASPLPSGSQEELPLTSEEASTSATTPLPEEGGTFVSGEGWVQ